MVLKNVFSYLLGAVALVSLAFGTGVASAAPYSVQSDDVLSIRVSGEPGLSQNYVVDDKGDITVEMVGKVHVAGLSAPQVQERVTKELGRYLKIGLFEVTVSVVGETGNRVLVYGEVAKPGMVKLRNDAKLLDVLAEAGQPTMNADTARISISHADGSKSQTVDLAAVLKDAALNMVLRVGDTVTVPSRTTHSVRVDGEVRNVGPLMLDNVTTAFAAVMAAVPNEKADWTRVALRRKDSSIPLMLDLSQVRSGQLKDDLMLQEGDRLTVLSKFSGTVRISGEVKSAGEKELNGPTQLWDILTGAAGGFTEKADTMRVQVLHPGQPTKVVNLLAVSKGQRRADDPELEVHTGDVVFVPSGTATIRGEVKTPVTEKALNGVTNIYDFIMSAGGGFTDNADRSKIQVTRDGKIIRTVDLVQVIDGKKSFDDPDLALQSGDIISIPNDNENRFAIVGGVKKPGRYPVKPGMTLMDAITVAEGFTDRATHKQFVIAPASQFTPDGKLKGLDTEKPGARKSSSKVADPEALGMRVIDYKKLLKGDPTQNVALNPGDRILIPEEAPIPPGGRRPSFLESLLRVVPLVGTFMTGGIGGGYGGY